MFQFGREQKIFDIAGVKIGGQPGQLPTVMMGSIFYHKHNIVTNEKTGEFDRKKAEELLQKEGEISNYTGKPRIVDVCCSWTAAFEKFIEFVSNKTNCPISIDGTTPEVRIAGAKYVGEVGLSNRVVYNSITPHTKEEELSAIKEAKIKSAILLTINTKNPTINGRLDVIDNLLNIAQKAGIEKVLIDATVMDIPDPGLVSKTIYLIKEKYGLPAGAGAHNAVDRLMERRRLNYTERLIASNAANLLPIVMGANFVLYGPIENYEWTYFGCALADAWVSYSIMQEYKMRPLISDHPLFKIFR